MLWFAGFGWVVLVLGEGLGVACCLRCMQSLAVALRLGVFAIFLDAKKFCMES